MAEMKKEASDKVLADYRTTIAALTVNDRIGAEQQLQLVEQICDEVDSVGSARRDFYDTRRKVLEMYEGQRPVKKTTPFEGCADVKTGLTFGKVETLHASLLPQVYSPDWGRWEPLDDASKENLENNEKFMRWDAHQSRLEELVDDYLYNLILESTVVFKVRWDVDFKWVRRLVPLPERIARRAAEALKSAISILTSITLKPSDYKTTYTFSKFERAILECPLIDDVGFPTDSVPDYDENKLSWIWHRTYPTLDWLEEKGKIGLFVNEQKVRAEIQDKVMLEYKARVKAGPLQSERQRQEGTKVMPADAGERTVCLIERYGKVKVPGVGRIECITFIEKDSRTFLGCMPLTSVMRDGIRPWVIARYINRKGRMLGKTPAEPIAELEDAVNTILNQGLDIGTVTILPPMLIRNGAGLKAQQIRLQPGITIPVDDVNADAKWMSIPNNTLVSISQVRTLMEVANEVMGIGPIQAGQESPVNRSRSTARGTMVIASKGDIRIASVAARCRQPLARAIELKRRMWAQNMPPGMADFVVDDKGVRLFPQGLSAENMAGNYAFILDADPTAGDDETKNANVSLRYQVGLQNPLVLQNPAALHHITTDFYEAAGDTEMAKILGPRPETPGIVIGKTVATEINMLRHGNIPTTREGDNPVQLLQGLLAFAMGPTVEEWPPENKACLETRVEVLKVEVAARAQQNQQEALNQEMQAPMQGGTNVGTPGGGVGGPEMLGGMAAPARAPGVGMPAPVGPLAGGG